MYKDKKNIKRIAIGAASILFLVIFGVMGFQYCEDKRLEEEKNEKVRKHKEKEKEIRDTITEQYVVNYSKKVLNPYFESIDSIKLWAFGGVTRIIYIFYDYAKNDYCASIEVTGEVIKGKAILTSASPYKFSYNDTIFYSQIKSPDVTPSKLYINDANKYPIYPPLSDAIGFEMKKAAAEKEAMEKEQIKKQQNSTSFIIDGIYVKFKKFDGNSFVFEISSGLQPEQIVKAIEKIGKGNMVQFYKGNSHYADYVYSTQCIIYKGTGTIYKVINGKPVKAN